MAQLCLLCYPKICYCKPCDLSLQGHDAWMTSRTCSKQCVIPAPLLQTNQVLKTLMFVGFCAVSHPDLAHPCMLFSCATSVCKLSPTLKHPKPSNVCRHKVHDFSLILHNKEAVHV